MATTPPLSITPIEVFKTLADETRYYTVMLLLSRGELCVCDVVAALNESQPKISRHLALLRQSALVSTRRQGHWVYYQINPALPQWLFDTLKNLLQEDKTLAAWLSTLPQSQSCDTAQ